MHNNNNPFSNYIKCYLVIDHLDNMFIIIIISGEFQLNLNSKIKPIKLITVLKT